MIDEKILRNEERAVFALRSLYRGFGYSKYKMSKFEEYDLYVRNKDFLISDSIITFTDTNGKLMALKPDVTLSIIKNSKDCKGLVQKLYYNENVYRISKDSHCFKEITQAGLECIGDIGIYDVCEVVYLALKSLETIDSEYILDLSHAGLADALISLCSEDSAVKQKLITFIQSKSSGEIASMVKKGEIDEKGAEIALALTKTYPDCASLRSALEDYCESEKVKAPLDEFCAVYESAQKLQLSARINIDFSLISDSSYYSGIIFKGYIKGIPTSILSGGQYDKLMKKMGKTSSAIGFAVYLDMLERHGGNDSDFCYDMVLLQGEGSDPAEIIGTARALSEKGLNVIVLKSLDEQIKYKSVIKFTKDGMEGA